MKSSTPKIFIFDNDEDILSICPLVKKTERVANIPVIYFTDNNDIKSLSKNAGADAYLSKPFNVEELGDIINAIV